MPRLFIGLPLNEADSNGNLEKENSLEQRSNNSGSLQNVYHFLIDYNKELKVVSPENYHITLKFFGECSDKNTEKIVNHFKNIGNVKKKLTYTLAGLGVFPDLKKANVIWAGLKTDESIINKLVNDIESFSSKMGFKKEKGKFVPHLTLARVRKGMTLNENLRQFIVENKETYYHNSSFNKIVLFESILNPEGPFYKELHSVELNHFATEEE